MPLYSLSFQGLQILSPLRKCIFANNLWKIMLIDFLTFLEPMQIQKYCTGMHSCFLSLPQGNSYTQKELYHWWVQHLPLGYLDSCWPGKQRVSLIVTYLWCLWRKSYHQVFRYLNFFSWLFPNFFLWKTTQHPSSRNFWENFKQEKTQSL